MILKRNFIDVKRLINIGVNYIVRTQWLTDYLKCIAKPLEYVNSNTVSNNNRISEYVLYNGQKLSLKTFVDDKYDLVERRTIITENVEPVYSLSGYYDYDTREWMPEIDQNKTTFNGYVSPLTGNTYTYTLEEDIPENSPMRGYMYYENEYEPLQDVELFYIYDSNGEHIYTIENIENTNRYKYFLEGQSDEGLIIYIHNDKYTDLSANDIQYILGLLSRYIMAPITYRIEGYS